MKFYEQKKPYCLIKAKNDEDMKNIFAKEVNGDILEFPDLYQLREISAEEAYDIYSKATDEDGNPIDKAEIDSTFNSDVSEALAVSRELI